MTTVEDKLTTKAPKNGAPTKPESQGEPKIIPRDKIVVDPKENARDYFGKPVKATAKSRQLSIEDLAASIRENGLDNWLTVRPHGDKYLLTAGSRRIRAIDLLGWTEVPCVVVKSMRDEFDVLCRQLVENVQRENLSSPELAFGLLHLKELAKARGEKLTGEQIGARIQRSDKNVLNLLRAAKNLIPEWARAWKGEGGIAIGDHEAYRLAALSPEEQKREYDAEKERLAAEQEEEGEDGKKKRKTGTGVPPMMRREAIEALMRTISTRPTFEAEVEEVALGGKDRTRVASEELSDEALKFGRALLRTVLAPKDATPIFRYRPSEEVEEGS